MKLINCLDEVATYQAEWFSYYCLAVIFAIVISYGLALLTENNSKR